MSMSLNDAIALARVISRYMELTLGPGSMAEQESAPQLTNFVSIQSYSAYHEILTHTLTNIWT